MTYFIINCLEILLSIENDLLGTNSRSQEINYVFCSSCPAAADAALEY